jgi:hypothetical protein
MSVEERRLPIHKKLSRSRGERWLTLELLLEVNVQY